MTDEKLKQFNHSCCNVSTSEDLSICKECGNRGKAVKEITLKSLLKESRLEAIKDLEGFYFCGAPKCKVAYFNNKQNIYIPKEDVKIRIGIKETEDPIPVCYCFGWTREKIFNQIKELGKTSAVEEISAKVKAGECACEVNNPSGECCLGEVNRVVKIGIELFGKKKGTIEGKFKNLLVVVSAIISAIVSSICCIGPIFLALLSVGGAGLFSKFATLRPYFILITAVLLGLAFYLTYRKRKVICEDGTCEIKSAGKWNKIALWGGTILVLFFLALPYLRNFSNSTPASNQMVSETVGVIIDVEGMTCSGCGFNVESAVKKLDGIIEAKADHQKGKVDVKFEKGKITADNIVETINKAGYKASNEVKYSKTASNTA